jgi:hypothetical protein
MLISSGVLAKRESLSTTGDVKRKGLVQPFALSAEIAERFSWAGLRWQSKVANKDEHAYIDVLYLFN